jgi:hypothetical protein
MEMTMEPVSIFKKRNKMKKLITLLSVLAFFSCKKDSFNNQADGFKELQLPNSVKGKWQWINEWGCGFAPTFRKPDSNQTFILTILDDKYMWCKNDTCVTGEWFYGTKHREGMRYADTLMFFSTPFPLNNFVITEPARPIVTDTNLIAVSCFSDVFIKKK